MAGGTAGLETREQIHDVPDGQRTCPECGQAFEFLGSECGEQIDWQARVTGSCTAGCGTGGAASARGRGRCRAASTEPGAQGPVHRGVPGPAAVQKYVLGLPVHRIARALAADGLDVAEGTISGALKAVADLLVPLDDAIGARNAEAVHVHADETSWRGFEQVEGKDGHRWWLWGSVRHRHTAVSPAQRAGMGGEFLGSMTTESERIQGK